MYPDGGIKRVRVYGRLHKTAEPVTGVPTPGVLHEPEPSPMPLSTCTTSPALTNGTQEANASKAVNGSLMPSVHQVAESTTIALPLTTEAFAPFGQVLMAWNEPAAVPKGIKVTSANQDTAHKFHLLSQVESSYPPGKPARTGFSVYRSSPAGANPGEYWPIRLLERHSCTNQAFIPMGSSGKREDELPKPGKAYLVIVAHNGPDDKPDLHTLRAFVATTSQGIVYNTGVWRKREDMYYCCSVAEVDL